MGDVKISDSMIKDGLWDPYGDKHMGNCAEMCAEKYTFTREAQDAFALESYKRAQGAMEAGEFEAELASVSVPQRKGDPIVVDKDEEPFGAPLDKMAVAQAGEMPRCAHDRTNTALPSSKPGLKRRLKLRLGSGLGIRVEFLDERLDSFS